MTEKDDAAKTPETPEVKPDAKPEAPPEATKPVEATPPAAAATTAAAGAATATAAPADPIAAKLAEAGITDAATVEAIKGLGAESVEDLSGLTADMLAGVGIPPLKANKLLAKLTTPAPSAAPAGAVDMNAAAMNMDAVLPSVPNDDSWLNSLRAGGVLKIEQSTVISAVRAALADRFGLYEIPKELVRAMEEYVDVTEEQVGEEFWQIRKQLTRRSYGDLFQAIDGLDGSYVTDKRKNELLSRISDNLWPAIFTFNESLAGWQESWMQGAANPAMMMAAMAGLAGGGVGMPPGMMQPPDCGVLRDAAETVNDALNRTFRGTGVQITAALAYEANQIKAMIENPRLPMLCGQPNRELLLKKLKVSVPAIYPRLETNLTRFILGIMQTDRVPAGNDELQYFGTLFMLGNQIPWEDLERHSFRDSGKGRRPRGISAKQNDPFGE